MTKLCGDAKVYTEFSWSQFLILEDKDVDFLSSTESVFHMGISPSDFKKQQESQSDLLAPAVFQVPLTQIVNMSEEYILTPLLI